ncbi:MAG: hypothetical protein JWQ27_1312 [Ferruginibacter sp.]|nr:hypothetical protein [Ferruginibacter sp.]
MTSKANSPEAYLKELPEDRRGAMTKLRNVIKKNIPKGFQEVMSYGMLGYVVPHSVYPAGYHCDPKLPLPFICLASQKNFISLYHMGVYGKPELLEWFVTEYPKYSDAKLDMGKSCIRFKNPENIPYKLIEELIKKVSLKDWIDTYEKNMKREG